MPQKTISKKIYDFLIEQKAFSEKKLEPLLKAEKDKEKEPLDIALEQGLIIDEKIGELLSKKYTIPWADLMKENIEEGVFHLVPQIVSEAKGVVAFGRDQAGIKVGMIDPDDLSMKHLLEKRLGEPLQYFVITPKGLKKAVAQYQGSLSEAFKQIYHSIKDPSLSREERDEAGVELLDTIIHYAYKNHASDIHVEPYTRKIVIRFRIDGVMHDVLEMPKELADLVITRIKILSRMRTDEHRAAQDGKFRFSADEEKIDIRVSVVPVTNGENSVMRLLSSKTQQFNLDDLGFGEADFKKTKQAIKKPYGMILVTGPTGSGKTTTVYAILKILNRREVNIITIEDPVEYDIEGVTQIQVDAKTNLTFAKGLRAILRQDPNIIVVGEVRDPETAGIAINSAMTGHLVLSTLHANDTATTLPRLLDMGIEPFLVASTVNIVIAQRLVRKICEKCKKSYPATPEEKRLLEDEPMLKEKILAKAGKTLQYVKWSRGQGCQSCSRTGYRGRIGIYEIMEITEGLKELIVKRSTADALMAAAVKGGMTTMLDDGIDKMFAGVTTLEEVIRVTRT